MKNALLNLCIRTFVALLRCFSRNVRRRIIFFIAVGILKLAKKTRLRAIKNISNAMPTWSDRKVEKIAFESYQHIVFGVTECFWLEDIEMEIECSEDTLKLLHNPNGCSICTMHMSCYEAAPFAIQKLLGSCTTLSKIPKFISGAKDVYKRANIDVIDKSDPNSFFKLLQASRDCASICLHGDHYADDVDVTFFGQLTQAPSGSAMISAYSKVPLLLCYAILQKNGRYKVQIETVVENHVANNKADIAQAIAQVYARFEVVISTYPEQWYWSYNRWRREPKHD